METVNIFYGKLAAILVTVILAAGISGGSTSLITGDRASVESALKASLMSGKVPPDFQITKMIRMAQEVLHRIRGLDPQKCVNLTQFFHRNASIGLRGASQEE